MDISKFLELLEADLESMRKEYDDCAIKIKQDNADITENSAFHSLESKMTDLKSQMDTRLMCKAFIKNVDPVLKDKVCIGSKFKCNLNGSPIICILAPWTLMEFKDLGYIFLNVHSSLGEKVLGCTNGMSVTAGDNTISNISVS